VGYIGSREAPDILLTGLQRLEYRGYDSAGIAVVNADGLTIRKKKGKVSDLAALLRTDPTTGTIGIGHTRWATHGPPSDVNAHPHADDDVDFALVHNGIIENYAALRESLKKKGVTFQSQTDTEVLAELIADVRRSTGLPLEEAVRQALTQVVGTYGIAVVSGEDDDLLIAARKGSPLILGVGDNEYFVASDAAPLVEHTRQVVYLNDGEMVVVRRSGYEVKTIDNTPLEKEIHQLEWDLEQIEKGGFEHFMLKEIMEQPEALENCIRGRIRLEENTVKLGGLMDVLEKLQQAER